MNFEDAAEALRRGGVLLLSTDTLPGFHCRADDQVAVLRVAGIKGRDTGKPLLVLASSLEQALSVCAPLNPSQQAHCRACWPGPFSLILPVGTLLADRVSCGLGTVAIRVPADESLRNLMAAVGMPLVSTSANLQDEEPMVQIEAACDHFMDHLDGAWDSGSCSPLAGLASALVDLCGEHPQILRKGPLDFPSL